MTVEAFANLIGCEIICMPSPEKEVDGAYIGDLLSWVMGKAAEGVRPDENALEAARSKGVNILSTQMSAYEVATLISGHGI